MLVVMASSVALIAGCATTKTAKFDAKGTDNKAKVFEITYDSGLNNVSAKLNGQDMGPSRDYQYPAKMDGANSILKLEPQGPFLITGGNTCVCYPFGGGLRCLGNPCP